MILCHPVNTAIMYKKILFLLPLLPVFLSLPAQEPVTRSLGSFSKLVATDRVIVRLVKAERESATISVQGIDESAVKTEVEGNTIIISIYGEPFTKKKVMVTLNYVTLTDITVNGSAEVTTTSLFKAGSLAVDLKSGGMLYLDADIENLNSRVIEGALLTAEGYATEHNIVVATSGTVSAYDLESESVIVKATTGGKAKINVETSLDADAGSKGFITYKGNPAQIKRTVNSGGTIAVYEP